MLLLPPKMQDLKKHFDTFDLDTYDTSYVIKQKEEETLCIDYLQIRQNCIFMHLFLMCQKSPISPQKTPKIELFHDLIHFN